VTPFACKLLSEQGFGFWKANVVKSRVFASHFPSDEVQNEAEIRGSTFWDRPRRAGIRRLTGRAARKLGPLDESSQPSTSNDTLCWGLNSNTLTLELQCLQKWLLFLLAPHKADLLPSADRPSLAPFHSQCFILNWASALRNLRSVEFAQLSSWLTPTRRIIRGLRLPVRHRRAWASSLRASTSLRNQQESET